jgi:hypothetical protein
MFLKAVSGGLLNFKGLLDEFEKSKKGQNEHQTDGYIFRYAYFSLYITIISRLKYGLKILNVR